MKRRTFSKNFKYQTVHQILHDNKSIKIMSQQLDIHVCTLYRWVSEYGKYGEDAFPGNGKPNFILIEEIKRLKKEKLALMNELERSLIFQEQVSSFLKKAKFIWY